MRRNSVNPVFVIVVIVSAIVALVGSLTSYRVVPVGHVGVATFMGDVNESLHEAGAYFPVNPFSDWEYFDCRQKTLAMEDVGIPSQDKLTTNMDVSIQYRVVPSLAAQAFKDTGTAEALVDVHLVPITRSVLRELGKSVRRAEDFYSETMQETLQTQAREAIAEYCGPKGIEVQSVLLRDIELPMVIQEAVRQTKERQEQTQREQAEFERFEIEQKQRVAQATAERDAAAQRAEQIRLLADAEAHAIQAQGVALRDNPGVLQLRAIEKWDGVLPQVAGSDSAFTLLLPKP